MPVDGIRLAGPDDASLLAGLLRAAFAQQADELGLRADQYPRHPAFRTAEAVVEEMREGFIFFILEADREPVGCVAIRTDAPHGGDGYLGRLAVVPAARGRGYGRLLMAFAEVALCDRGARTVRIGVLRELTGLQEYYRRLGYTSVQVEQCEGTGLPAVFMDKPLR
ncbi:MAG: GNAT family N-acetyltransferase [Armatimonadota bacterium]